MGRIRLARIAGSSETTEQVSRGCARKESKHARPRSRFGQRSGTENLPHTLSDQSAVRGIKCIERRPLVGSRRGNRKRRRSSDQNPVELGNRSISISRLELLRTEGDCLKDILNRVQSPEHLIWLSCYCFPYASLPGWIPMERLTVLQLQGNKLKSLWRQFQVYYCLLFFSSDVEDYIRGQ